MSPRQSAAAQLLLRGLPQDPPRRAPQTGAVTAVTPATNLRRINQLALVGRQARQALRMRDQALHRENQVADQALRRSDQEIRARLAALEQRCIRGTSQASISDGSYNEVYAALGGPMSMKQPLPYFTGGTGHHKYACVAASTVNQTFVIPALESALVWVSPYKREDILQAALTAGGGATGEPVTGRPFSKEDCMTDKTIAGQVKAPFVDHIPSELLENGNAVKTAPLFMNIPWSNGQPVPAQMQACAVHMEVMTPYEGTASVYACYPGDAPSHIGRSQQAHTRDVAANDVMPPDLEKRFRIPYAPSAGGQDIITASARLGTNHLIAGNSTKSFSGFSQPDDSWTFIGELDATDAPNAGTTSNQNGFSPRDNIVYNMQFGWFLVKNTSSTAAITVTMQANIKYSMLMQLDSSTRSVSALASILARDANTLRRHVPNQFPRAHTTPTGVGTLAGIKNKIAEVARKYGANQKQAHNASQSFGTKHPVHVDNKTHISASTKEELQTGAAIAMGGHLASKTKVGQGLLSKAKSWFTTAEEEVATISRGPIVEEVIEGAEAVGEGALIAV